MFVSPNYRISFESFPLYFAHEKNDKLLKSTAQVFVRHNATNDDDLKFRSCFAFTQEKRFRHPGLK